jgi:hypothetical protein
LEESDEEEGDGDYWETHSPGSFYGSKDIEGTIKLMERG